MASKRSSGRLSGRGRRPKRQNPSRQLKQAVEEIAEMVRPDLNEEQRGRVVEIVAADVQPAARKIGRDEVRRTQLAVARAAGEVRPKVFRHSRLAH